MIASLPLEGIRILDLSRVLAGPFCTMMLGDLGADVLKIERAGLGDETRGWGPPFREDGQSAYFLSANRNKLSLGLDFANLTDIALLRTLVAEADVVIENFLPGSLARFGIAADTMLALHPQLVWCTISGFGSDSDRPGYDFVVQAECGWMTITGPVEGEPYKVGVALADVIAGKDAAVAILAALVGRARPAAVSHRRLNISLAHSATAALVNVAQNVLVSGADAGRWGNAHPNLVPYQLFDTADRPLVIAVGNDKQWKNLVDALELTELAADASFNSNAGRLAGRDVIVTALNLRLITQPAAHWATLFEDAGVPCGLVKTVAEALETVTASPESGVAPTAGGAVRRLPPRLDEHGELIRKLHWSAFKVVPILG